MAAAATSDNHGPGAEGFVKLLSLLGLLPDPVRIKADVDRARKAHPNDDAGQLANQFVRSAAWKLAGAGAAAALPGVVPGVGTGVEIGLSLTTAAGELHYLMRSLAAMQMQTACTFGHEIADPQNPEMLHPDRLDEITLVWGLQTGLVVPAKEAAKRVGTKIGVTQCNRRVRGDLLSRINRKVSTTVLTKWGTKRGGVALGRMIPFGVGVTVGAGMNSAAARSLGRACLKFYGEILPGGEDLLIVD